MPIAYSRLKGNIFPSPAFPSGSYGLIKSECSHKLRPLKVMLALSIKVFLNHGLGS